MKKITLALMIVFSCFGVSFAQKGKQATAQEKKDLFQLILKDKDVSENLSSVDGGETKLAETLKVEKKDLNKDGQYEYIATLENEFMCGAHANCPSWVYSKAGGNYQLLLSTHGQQLREQKTLTSKFVDLRSDGSDSAFESSYTIYKFDGNKYKAADCFTVNNEGKKPKTTRIQCQE